MLGLTASVIDQRNCKVESLRLQLRDLEKCLLCKIGVVILVAFLCMTLNNFLLDNTTSVAAFQVL